MKKHTTWQDYYQVKYLLLNYYPEDYSVNAILILPPGCPILAKDSADDMSGTSPKTARLSNFGDRLCRWPVWDESENYRIFSLGPPRWYDFDAWAWVSGRRFTDIHDWKVVQTLGPESDAESFNAKIKNFRAQLRGTNWRAQKTFVTT